MQDFSIDVSFFPLLSTFSVWKPLTNVVITFFEKKNQPCLAIEALGNDWMVTYPYLFFFILSTFASGIARGKIWGGPAGSEQFKF